MTHDVIITGYGPTGMALAALLGRLGRSVLVLERYDGLYALPRAACWDDETMRTFQHLGVAEAMLAGANIQRGYEWINAEGEVLLDIAYDNPGRCGWPSQYMIYQPHMEDVLDRLVKSTPGVELRRGMTVDGIVQDGAGATVRAVDAQGARHEFRGAWVIGADGGNGHVRRYIDAGLDEYGFSENWLVCDFEMKRFVPALPSFRQVCNPAQPISIVNIGPKHHRFSFRLEKGDDPEAILRPETVWARVRELIGPEDAALIRVANYTFVSCIVDEWRKGRVLLAGDAAHQMPPFLAQGMVSGIRDARNLAWKLDLVLSGAPETLLDSYQQEREPHVRFITEKAIELGRVQTERDPERARARDERLLALRAANRAPDKLVYPPLRGGMIGPGGGELLPQGLVSSAARTALFDEIAGTGWLIVAKGPDALAALSAQDRADWAALGGSEAVFGLSRIVGGGDLSDTNGLYTRWFDANGAAAAIVRPDSHVYALAPDAGALPGLLDALLHALGRRKALARAAS